MEECHFNLKVALLHGCFSRYQIVQIVPNRAKRLAFLCLSYKFSKTLFALIRLYFVD